MSERIFLADAMPACRRAERPCGRAVHVSPRTFFIFETGQNAGAVRGLTTAACGAAEKQCDAIH
jgi:hypothetical protein